MKSVIMNLQHQEPQKLTRRSPSPPLTNRHRSITPPTHQSRRTVGFVEPFNQHNNPPPMVFVSFKLDFSQYKNHFSRHRQVEQKVLQQILFEVHEHLNKENIEKYIK